MDTSTDTGGTGTPTHTTLPTYPFQHHTYWLTETARPAANQSVGGTDSGERAFWEAVERQDLDTVAEALGTDRSGALGEVLPVLSAWRRGRQDRQIVDSWRVRTRWTHVSRPAAALTGTWFVVTPTQAVEEGPVEKVIAALRAGGARLVLIPGPAIASERGGLVARLREAAEADAGAGRGAAVGVLSLLALDETPHAEHPAITNGLAATLLLVQALDEADVTGRLWIVTQAAVNAAQGDRVDHPLQALVAGLGRVLAVEQPTRWGGLVDLPSSLDEEVTTRLVAVLASGDTDVDTDVDDQLAVRPTGTLARRLVRAPLVDDVAGAPWRPRGPVLVTGSATAAGAQVADWLERDGAERLLVADNASLATDPAGATPVPAGEPPTAVVHVPVIGAGDNGGDGDGDGDGDGTSDDGIGDDGGDAPTALIADLEIAALAAAVGPAVVGASRLHEQVADRPVDAFVLFSSASGVWGDAGRGADAVVGAYLEALAEYRRGRDLPATHLAWGHWPDLAPAGSGGNGGRDVVPQPGRGEARMGDAVRPLVPALALGALREAIERGESGLLLADVDWSRLASVRGAAPAGLLAALAGPRPVAEAEAGRGDSANRAAQELVERLATLDETGQDQVLVERVRIEVAAVLGADSPDDVDPRRALKDLGFDSLAAVSLRNRLSSATGLSLPTTVAFDHPTTEAVAAFLRTRLAPQAPAEGVEAQLDRLAATVATQTDEAQRRRTANRLQDLLRQLTVAASAGGDDIAAAIHDGSDDDLFDLLDRTFEQS
ncbi:conserved hypothetical protein [Frankia canadensis]|uniref:Carrier domain-containing protein n=1 Tax=Frankia canadensis TaxID=1836972 RepID=A0A2I2KWN8_9ACTN|nr:KR domain-containing protein [Frankia canadensis]SNQ50068.1 conserved hypothetical protein [Frankia canadensis]SOU57358.1 conserved hypothetical protein [Frankia canadensis]